MIGSRYPRGYGEKMVQIFLTHVVSDDFFSGLGLGAVDRCEKHLDSIFSGGEDGNARCFPNADHFQARIHIWRETCRGA